jgi:hypothetical protein
VREPWTDGLSACPRGMCITTKRLTAHDKNTFAEEAVHGEAQPQSRRGARCPARGP